VLIALAAIKVADLSVRSAASPLEDPIKFVWPAP
jgi:hypothetical protein